MFCSFLLVWVEEKDRIADWAGARDWVRPGDFAILLFEPHVSHANLRGSLYVGALKCASLVIRDGSLAIQFPVTLHVYSCPGEMLRS